MGKNVEKTLNFKHEKKFWKSESIKRQAQSLGGQMYVFGYKEKGLTT